MFDHLQPYARVLKDLTAAANASKQLRRRLGQKKKKKKPRLQITSQNQ